MLEKVILDTNMYLITENSNGDKLLKKISSVNINNIDDIKNYDFKKSEILSCRINNDVLTKLKFKSIIDHIYNILNDGAIIIKNSKLNIKTLKKLDEGFYYNENLGISIQGADSNKSLLEIINQCTKHSIKLNMKIKLYDDKYVNIDF